MEENNVRVIELARALLAAGRREEALEAFAAVLRDPSAAPEETMEAALCVLREGGDYRISYEAFLRLYEAGVPDALRVLTEAFYEPNARDLRKQYQKNVRLLRKYPYLFRRDFPGFEDLPLRFYPFDEESCFPFDGERFLPRYILRDPVVSRNFFRDLTQPVFASGVFSQYELEYLRDNVRRSEDLGRENHVYLHYADWGVFCAYLQVLDLRPLLREEKLVFLIGEERDLYPIDFQERFGLDYRRDAPRPVGIREINRLIWHTQLSSHNGGDFFNEIFDGHPNLLYRSSVLMEEVERQVDAVLKRLRTAPDLNAARSALSAWRRPEIVEELWRLRDRTEKDVLTAMYLDREDWNAAADPDSRIAPALFFQPHFQSLVYTLRFGSGLDVCPESTAAEQILRSPLLRQFPYVKVFTPLRRFTTSYGGALRFIRTRGRKEALRALSASAGGKSIPYDPLFMDTILYRVMNRSYMADPEDPLFRDSVVVRFEDGKLNPAATLTRLAAFLDLPYTESMTYCSEQGRRDPHSELGDDAYAAGFSLSSVYKTYDEYLNESERRFLEFCFRDAYAFYGYDFQYWDGKMPDQAEMNRWVDGFTTLDRHIREDWAELSPCLCPGDRPGEWYVGEPGTLPDRDWDRARLLEERLSEYHRNRRTFGGAMRLNLRFVNRHGVPLRMIPILEPDPDLLDRPLYR